jgi:hypothetical protein
VGVDHRYKMKERELVFSSYALDANLAKKSFEDLEGLC